MLKVPLDQGLSRDLWYCHIKAETCVRLFLCDVPGLFVLYFCFLGVNSNYGPYKNLPMTRFEPWMSGIKIGGYAI